VKGETKNQPDPELNDANTEADEFSTNQEAVSIPWFCGERKVALRWISPIYNQYTKEAPQERPGKK
jgi:hypothetical protein